MFYTNIPAVNLFSSNWSIVLKKICSKMKLCCTCINSVWTILQLYCWKKHFAKAHLLLSLPECIWRKNFHIFWKKYWTFVLPIPAHFCPYTCICCKPDFALCMHDICFFNRKWQRCTALIFITSSGDFICKLLPFVMLSLVVANRGTRHSFWHKNVWKQQKFTYSS